MSFLSKHSALPIVCFLTLIRFFFFFLLLFLWTIYKLQLKRCCFKRGNKYCELRVIKIKRAAIGEKKTSNSLTITLEIESCRMNAQRRTAIAMITPRAAHTLEKVDHIHWMGCNFPYPGCFTHPKKLKSPKPKPKKIKV